MGKISASLSILAAATLLWAAAYFINDYTLKGYIRSEAKKNEAKLTQQREGKDLPESLEELVAYAQKSVDEGTRNSDAEAIISALRAFQKALAIEPKDPRALLGIADLSFQSGVLDKAKDYYEKYLQIRPEDAKVKNDYAVLLAQMGQTKEAISMINEMLSKDPNSFSHKLSLALVYRLDGQLEEAKKVATTALKTAPDERGKKVTEDFLASLTSSPETAVSSAVDTTVFSNASGAEHPSASSLETFFKAHPIIGPKLAELRPSGETLLVLLKDFPVQNMPPFAKASLTEKVKAILATSPYQKVLIYDEANEADVIEVVR